MLTPANEFFYPKSVDAIVPNPIQRSATEIIDQAIRENRKSETLLYIFATLLVFVGALVILYSVWKGQTVGSLVGAFSTSLFVPAMRYAKAIRKENIAIRLLEAPLIRADTAKDAAEAIRANFMQTQSEEPPAIAGKRKRV